MKLGRVVLVASGLLLGGGAAAGAQETDGTGIPACDRFLAAYRQCVAGDGVPAQARSAMLGGIASMGGTFRDVAARDPASRGSLARQCLASHAQVRTQMVAAFKCPFPEAATDADAAAAEAGAAPALPAPAASASSGGRKAAPVVAASPAELEATKADAYTKVQNDLVEWNPMRKHLAEHLRNNERVLRLGTKLGANAWYSFGIGDFDNRIESLQAAMALPGAVPGADEAAARLLAAMKAANPVIKGLARYQTTREFKEDSFKYAQQQQPLLVKAMEETISASAAFGDRLFDRRMTLDEARMAEMPKDSFARRLLDTSLAARRVVRAHQVSEKPADAGMVTDAVARLQASNRQLQDAVDVLDPKVDSACRSYAEAVDTVVGKARDYARDLKGRSDVGSSSEAFATAYNRSLTDLSRCRRGERRADG